MPALAELGASESLSMIVTRFLRTTILIDATCAQSFQVEGPRNKEDLPIYLKHNREIFFGNFSRRKTVNDDVSRESAPSRWLG